MKRFFTLAVAALSLCTACRVGGHDVPYGDTLPELADGYVGLVDGCFMVDGDPWFPLMLNYKAQMARVGDSLEVVPVSYYRGGTLDEHFDTIASWGFNAVRVCLDVLARDGDSAAMFRATRRMVQRADSAGLRVMLLVKPPFDPYWQAYTQGLLHALADLPALWAYDFLNEPLYFDPVPERDKMDAVRLVGKWRHWVRTCAPHQLFTVALAEPIEVFEWDPALLPVDFVEMHTYHPLRCASEMWWYAHHCGKPWMVGETGLPADNDSVPYDWQARYIASAFLWARSLGAAGFGLWEFQDHPEGVNFEAQYTGLRDTTGKAKPAVGVIREMALVCNDRCPDEGCEKPVNYYNMLAYSNICLMGRVIDKSTGRPIEGALVRGWNDDWSVGMNTYTDSSGRFTLYSNDYNVHFEVSAPAMSHLKFDRRDLKYRNVGSVDPDRLPDRLREYQQIDYRQYIDFDKDGIPLAMLSFDRRYFDKCSLVADMGSVGLVKLVVK